MMRSPLRKSHLESEPSIRHIRARAGFSIVFVPRSRNRSLNFERTRNDYENENEVDILLLESAVRWCDGSGRARTSPARPLSHDRSAHRGKFAVARSRVGGR